MINRFLHIALAVLILVSTSGIVLNQHFCHNQLVEVSITKAPLNCCGNTCKHCRTEVKFIKVTDAFHISQLTVHVFKSIQNLIYTTLPVSPSLYALEKYTLCYSSPPPLIKQVAIYTLVENFRL